MKELLFKEEYILRREELKKKTIQFFSTETAPKQKRVFVNILEDTERESKGDYYHRVQFILQTSASFIFLICDLFRLC